MYTDLYHPEFKISLNKYTNQKRHIERKINQILESPYSSERLKYELNGLRSCPVRGNFIIIFGILEEHKRNNFQFNFNLEVCRDLDDNVVLFITVGPHDEAYKVAKKMSVYEIPSELEDFL